METFSALHPDYSIPVEEPAPRPIPWPGPTSHTHAAAPPTLLRRGAGAGPLLAARAGTLSLGRGAHGRGLLIALVLTSGLVTKGDQMRVYREQASPGV